MKRKNKNILIFILIIFISIVFYYIPYIAINVNGLDEVVIEAGDEYIDEGARLKFNFTGLEILNDNVDTLKTGTYEIEYKFRNAVKKRIVKVVDTKEPILTLLGLETVYVVKDSEFVDPGCIAEDIVDGDLTSIIEKKDNIDSKTPGEYYISYYATDNSGNTGRVRRKVIVTEKGIDPNDLINFDLKLFYSDVFCASCEYDEEKYNELYFIGDSFFTYAAKSHVDGYERVFSHGMLYPNNVLERESLYKGDKIQYNQNLDCLLTKYEPKVAIILLGNLSVSETNAAYFKSSSEKLYSYLTSKYPNTSFVLCSMMPYNQSSDLINKKNGNALRQVRINEFNIALCELCREFGFKYMNVSEVLIDKATGYCKAEYLGSDGYHLNDNGYKLMFEYFKTHLDW